MKIGNKIKRLRCKASFTQEKLADLLGVSAQAVSKWENEVSMPDISLLPEIAEVFGISLDDLFDLKNDQKMRRIENRMAIEDELPDELFREYEAFLKDQLMSERNKFKTTSLLARLYHHRLGSDGRKAAYYARQTVRMAPEEKECQWILQRAEGAVAWDWNISNHSHTIDFFKQVIGEKYSLSDSPLPYRFLLENLIADHRTEEAREYLLRLAQLPARQQFMMPVYEAAIALAEFDEERADAIIAKALEDFPENSDLLFQVAQYYARKCNYDKAIQYYEASYAKEEERKPRFTDALEGIATIHEIRGEYGKAADTQKRILYALRNEWGFTEETVIQRTEQEIRCLKEKAEAIVSNPSF